MADTPDRKVSTPNSQDENSIPIPQPSAPPDMPEPWKRGTPLKNPLPKEADPSCWEQCYERVSKYDEDMCKVLKDDIEHLLIFAGLFSASVTAFVVESYQWLESSDDTSANLLAQLVSIQSNGTIPFTPSTPTSPSRSAVRINMYWFLSLVISLSAVLFGVLCLQWLREYQQPAVSSSFQDELRYRQLRYEGLQAWKVPQIITFLPSLLQIGLVLFFTGIVDLLWHRNREVAIVILVPMVCSGAFLLVTTFLPIYQAWRIRLNTDHIASIVQCPYKSPLSWLVYRSLLPLLDIGFSTRDNLYRWRFCRKSSYQSHWPGFDHFWVSYESMAPFSVLAKSIKWMLCEFKYSLAAIYPVYECLKDLDYHTERALAGPLREELTSTLGVSFSKSGAESPNEDFDIRTAASVLRLRESPAYKVAALEYSIQFAHQDSRYLLLIPTDWVFTLTREQLDEFAQQILMCTLQAMTNPHEVSTKLLNHITWLVKRAAASIPHEGHPIASYLLQKNFYSMRRCISDSNSASNSRRDDQKDDNEDDNDDDDAGTTVQKAHAVWDTLEWLTPSELPVAVQPYLADLVWTAIKRGGIGPLDCLRDPWVKFIARDTPPDVVDTMAERDSRLWWVKQWSERGKGVMDSGTSKGTSGVGTGGQMKMQQSALHRPSLTSASTSRTVVNPLKAVEDMV